MNKPVVDPSPVAKTLAEQKSDFTAEGAPLPGKVSNAIPDSSPELVAPNRHSTSGRATIKLKRAPAVVKP
jgi:hypothetical protein